MTYTSSDDAWSIVAPWVFRDKRYIVSADVREDVLIVQVEEEFTADRWRGQFEAKHIEELSRKTGNYKKFRVFLNMLESAITNSTDSVSLDLLTYTDLKLMWDKKMGSNKRTNLSPEGKTQAKRYLILTYSVEFDRIHYPLALPYCGQPDPLILQNNIRKLQLKLDEARKQVVQEGRHSVLAELQQENALLLQEKGRLEEELLTYKHTQFMEGNASREIGVLKRVIKNLEEEVIKEHSKHQKYINKRNKEVKELLRQIEDLQLSERSLKARVKSLTRELTVVKCGYRGSPISSSPYGANKNAKMCNQKSSNLRCRQPKRTPKSDYRINKRTPSPGNRTPRFDPTAYVEQKRRRQLEVDAKLGRFKGPVRSRSQSQSSDKMYSPIHKASTRNRHSGQYKSGHKSIQDSCRSSQSSVMSVISSDGEGKVAQTNIQKEIKGLTETGENLHHYKLPKTLSLASINQEEISEIDARLAALQEFMKRSLNPTTYTSTYTSK